MPPVMLDAGLAHCPCCDNYAMYCGYHTSNSVCVKCVCCGLMMVKTFPDEWPLGLYVRSETAEWNLNRLKDYVLLDAKEAWNRRTKIDWDTLEEVPQ